MIRERKKKKYIFPSNEAKNRIFEKIFFQNSKGKKEKKKIYILPSNEAKNRIFEKEKILFQNSKGKRGGKVYFSIK